MSHFYPELGASAPASALVIGRLVAARGASKYRVKLEHSAASADHGTAPELPHPHHGRGNGGGEKDSLAHLKKRLT